MTSTEEGLWERTAIQCQLMSQVCVILLCTVHKIRTKCKPWKSDCVFKINSRSTCPNFLCNLYPCHVPAIFIHYLRWKENEYRIWKKSLALYRIGGNSHDSQTGNYHVRNSWNVFLKCMLIFLFITDWLSDWWACNCFTCPPNMQH
jgi:hypothetical protein